MLARSLSRCYGGGRTVRRAATAADKVRIMPSPLTIEIVIEAVVGSTGIDALAGLNARAQLHRCSTEACRPSISCSAR